MFTLPCSVRTGLFLLAVAAWPARLVGQAASVDQTAAEDATLIVEASATAVWLRWSLPDNEFPDTPFLIHRLGSDGSDVLMEVPSPMPEDQVLTQGLMSADEYAEFVRTFSVDTALGAEEAQARALNRAVLTMATFSRPEWARVLGTLLEDTDVAQGVTYTYRVSTTVAAQPLVVGEEVVSTGNAAPLQAVSGLEGYADESGINLRWDLPRDGWIVGYHVRRMDPDSSERELAEQGVFVSQEPDSVTGELILPDVFLHDAEVVPNTTYAYSVTGLNVFGRLTPPSDWVTLHYPDPLPLEAPGVSAVDIRDREVELFWAVPDDARIAAIGVVRTLDPLLEPLPLTDELLPPSTTSYVDTAVQGGESYYYGLVVADSLGRRFGPGALRAARAINLAPPSAPTNLRAEPTEESLDLSWDPVQEPDVEGYQVVLLRGEDNETGVVLLTPELIAETRYGLGVPPGTLDELRLAVRAVNSSFVEGPLSEPISARILDTVPPGKPILLEIRAGEGFVSLGWASTDDPDVVGYRVLRRVQGEDGENFQLLEDSIPAGQTEVVDEDAIPGLLHAYTVEAVDASGNVSEQASPLAATPYRQNRPDAPDSLEASLLDEGGVRLSWRARPGGAALFYVVERGMPGDRWVQVSEPLLASTLEYTDPAGRSGYTYRIVAIDTAGQTSLPSLEAQVPE